MNRHLLIEERENLRGTRGGRPVAHELADDGPERKDMGSGMTHPVIRIVRDSLIESTRSVSVDEDFVPFLDERKGDERSADLDLG